VTLALTDPDSTRRRADLQPALRGATFELTSQGDLQQIDVRDPGGPRQQLSVLNLSQSVDDTAWATDPSGGCIRPTPPMTPLTWSPVPSVGSGARGGHTVWRQQCALDVPGPGYPANYLASLDP